MGKAKDRINLICLHAQALQNSGRLRSTIYCIKKYIYILNQDHTVLIRFPLIGYKESPFRTPISFIASDYDSSNFDIVDGRVVFIQTKGPYVREKSCKTTQFTPKQIRDLFKKYHPLRKQGTMLTLGKGLIGQLDESLSHIEFSGKDGTLIIKQRNIYSGSIIKVHLQEEEGFSRTKKVPDFKPIGIRTNDLFALFVWSPRLRFRFGLENVLWFENDNDKVPFTGVISHCLYDELSGDEK